MADRKGFVARFNTAKGFGLSEPEGHLDVLLDFSARQDEGYDSPEASDHPFAVSAGPNGKLQTHMLRREHSLPRSTRAAGGPR